ncbi:MAG TPA: hypothetical protein VFG60_07285 [Burkholderiaceae bacterium]|nr:hypothetical protein [Burkholderiaceae bacterium]
MTSKSPGRASASQPPAPPPFQRKIAIDRVQRVGILLLALIPLAAMLGAFGLRSDETAASGHGVSLQLRYPALMRYTTSLPLNMRIGNTSGRTLSHLSVRIDTDWLSSFSPSDFTPPVQRVTTHYAELRLPDLAPGDETLVVGMLQGQDRGRHGGRIAIAIGDRVAVQSDVRTIVLP